MERVRPFAVVERHESELSGLVPGPAALQPDCHAQHAVIGMVDQRRDHAGRAAAEAHLAQQGTERRGSPRQHQHRHRRAHRLVPVAELHQQHGMEHQQQIHDRQQPVQAEEMPVGKLLDQGDND